MKSIERLRAPTCRCRGARGSRPAESRRAARPAGWLPAPRRSRSGSRAADRTRSRSPCCRSSRRRTRRSSAVCRLRRVENSSGVRSRTGLPVLVGDDDVDAHVVDAGADARRRLLCVRCRRLLSVRCRRLRRPRLPGRRGLVGPRSSGLPGRWVRARGLWRGWGGLLRSPAARRSRAQSRTACSASTSRTVSRGADFFMTFRLPRGGIGPLPQRGRLNRNDNIAVQPSSAGARREIVEQS